MGLILLCAPGGIQVCRVLVGERCPAARVDRWLWVKSIVGVSVRVCCGYVTSAQHGCGNGRERDVEGVGARVWLGCGLQYMCVCVCVFLAGGAVCLSP